MNEFKVGDKVKIGSDNTTNPQRNGQVGIIHYIDNSSVPYQIKFDNGEYTWASSVEHIKPKKALKIKPDDMIRYMVYGVGCNNKSEMVNTEVELKDNLKEFSKNPQWNGRIIGYKMTPIFEAEQKTVLSKFKIKKK